MQTGLLTTPGTVPVELLGVIERLARVAAEIARLIALGPLGGQLGAHVGNNSDGDTQKALDVMADEAFVAALRGAGIRHYASEERPEVLELDADGELALAIDPLDGSSNIDVNVSIGTIFGISRAVSGTDPNDSFLRAGRNLIAAGYFIYGPSTVLVVSFGDGVMQFVLDRATGRFTQTPTRPRIPARSCEFAINASNYRHWAVPVRSYIDDCMSGEDGPCASNYNMRWIASLVAETHRILTRGGVFLYPADARPGYEQGRLRMVYECAPIAFVIEQAGGRATTGTDPILDRVPETLHARAPLVFGSADNVDRLTVYNDLPEQEVSALFGSRGLFRA